MISSKPQLSKIRKSITSISAADLTIGPTGVAVIGAANTGKSYTVLSLIDHLINQGLTPEEIHIEYIDLDSGFVELLEQLPFPNTYLSSIMYTLCTNFYEIQEATVTAYERLQHHKDEYGLEGCYIIVDNMVKAWEFSRDDVCSAVYGMSMTEKMKEARASQEKAKKTGGKGKGVFNQSLDYAIINPLHNNWADSFRTCGFNFIFLSPWSYQEIKDDNDKVIETKLRFGQKLNDFRVSYIIRKYFDASNIRRVDFVKSRKTRALPKGLKDTSWAGIFSELDKLFLIEQRERESKMKSRKFPTSPSPKPQNQIPEEPKLTQSTSDDW